jgi:hypothetical protein
MISKSKFDISRARAAFSKQPGNQNTDRPAYYPFHKLPENKSATLRFIPDANPDNELGFLVERRMHELLVDGDKSRVACLEMYGKKCPICDLSRQYYKAKDTVNGKKYWHKKDYMSKAIVVKDGMPADPETGETYTGKIVIVNLGKTLYDIIAHNISSGDLGEDLPCDIESGFDFIITRTTKPGPNGEKWSDYGLSKFARAPRALEDEEVALLELEDESGATPNFIDLSTMLPKEPEVEFVENLLEQSLGGGSRDDEEGEDEPAPRAAPKAGSAASKFGQKAAAKAPVNEDEEDTPAPRAPAKAVAKPAKAEAPAEDDEAEAEAFLAQIRNRRAAAKASADEE